MKNETFFDIRKSLLWLIFEQIRRWYFLILLGPFSVEGYKKGLQQKLCTKSLMLVTPRPYLTFIVGYRPFCAGCLAVVQSNRPWMQMQCSSFTRTITIRDYCQLYYCDAGPVCSAAFWNDDVEWWCIGLKLILYREDMMENVAGHHQWWGTNSQRWRQIHNCQPRALLLLFLLMKKTTIDYIAPLCWLLL